MSIAPDILAALFRRAAEQEFAGSALWSFLAGSALWSFLACRIADDRDLLEIAAVTQRGHFPPYMLLAAMHQLVLERKTPELDPTIQASAALGRAAAS